MTQKGTHTWDLIVQYHRCPKCGYIIESRENYQYCLGRYQKDLQCTRCQQFFTVFKQRRPSFGPFFGDSEPIEIDWS